MNDITLQSGRELKSPLMPMREDRMEVDNEEDNKKEALIEPPTEQVHTKRTTEV